MQISWDEAFRSMHAARDFQMGKVAEFSHSIVIPHASYSPWLNSAAFAAAYDKIRLNTMVDIYRCYELWSLVGQLAQLEGDIIEVGVWRGGTGCLMAHQAQSRWTEKRVFLCDTFAGVVKTGGNDAYYQGGEHSDTSAEIVKELALNLGLENIELLQGIFPEDTADKVADRKFCLCHIDVDVYQSALDVLNWVWPRLAVGGVVVYDDYGFKTCDGITRLVNERIPKVGALTIHNLNGHALTIKTAP